MTEERGGGGTIEAERERPKKGKAFRAPDYSRKRALMSNGRTKMTSRDESEEGMSRVATEAIRVSGVGACAILHSDPVERVRTRQSHANGRACFKASRDSTRSNVFESTEPATPAWPATRLGGRPARPSIRILRALHSGRRFRLGRGLLSQAPATPVLSLFVSRYDGMCIEIVIGA